MQHMTWEGDDCICISQKESGLAQSCSHLVSSPDPPCHRSGDKTSSHQPPILSMHNHAVTTLPCSQCTIMQSPPSHVLNAQSCSHHPPLLPMHNHAVTTLPCSQCTIMQSPTSQPPNDHPLLCDHAVTWEREKEEEGAGEER